VRFVTEGINGYGPEYRLYSRTVLFRLMSSQWRTVKHVETI